MALVVSVPPYVTVYDAVADVGFELALPTVMASGDDGALAL